MLLLNYLNEHTDLDWIREKETGTGFLTANDGHTSFFVDHNDGEYYISYSSYGNGGSKVTNNIYELIEIINSFKP